MLVLCRSGGLLCADVFWRAVHRLRGAPLAHSSDEALPVLEVLSLPVLGGVPGSLLVLPFRKVHLSSSHVGNERDRMGSCLGQVDICPLQKQLPGLLKERHDTTFGWLLVWPWLIAQELGLSCLLLSGGMKAFHLDAVAPCSCLLPFDYLQPSVFIKRGEERLPCLLRVKLLKAYWSVASPRPFKCSFLCYYEVVQILMTTSDNTARGFT